LNTQPAWTADHAVDAEGRLRIGGLVASELARSFGTPLYVIDGAAVRERMRRYRDALSRHGGVATYAAKAFLTAAIVRAAAAEGLWLDVVSGGELRLALRAGMPAERILLHGNNKSDAELMDAVNAGVGRIVVDSLAEIGRIDALARRRGRRQAVMLRVAPGVEGGAHLHIQTGQEDSKFGLGLRSGEALEGVRRALAAGALTLQGLHCHIGSQILDLSPFERATDAMLSFAFEARAATGWWPAELDLGGGLGVRYLPEDAPPTIEEHVAATAGRTAARLAQAGVAPPRVLLEPGRAIVAEAGVTLYTVGERKEIPGVRTYVAVDGGMGDNPRPALSGARYSAVLADRADRVGSELVTIAGRYCESGDLLVRDAWLPPARAGEILAVLSTGAYTHSMASTYNRVPRSAVVWVEHGRARVVVRRETDDELFALDVFDDDVALTLGASSLAAPAAGSGPRPRPAD
jgi:diaminopimelate decarboxylase